MCFNNLQVSITQIHKASVQKTWFFLRALFVFISVLYNRGLYMIHHLHILQWKTSRVFSKKQLNYILKDSFDKWFYDFLQVGLQKDFNKDVFFKFTWFFKPAVVMKSFKWLLMIQIFRVTVNLATLNGFS